MPNGMLAMGLPLIAGRAIEELAPNLTGDIMGQPISKLLTMGVGLGSVAFVANELAIKKLPMTPATMGAFLLGGTLLSGEIIKMVTDMVPTPAAARIVVRPTPVSARVGVPTRPSAKLKLY